VHDLAIELVSDGRKADVRVRAHVNALPGTEDRRSEMVEEDERPDQPRLYRGQSPAHGEVAEVDRAWRDDVRDSVALGGIAGGGVFAWKETHWITPSHETEATAGASGGFQGVLDDINAGVGLSAVTFTLAPPARHGRSRASVPVILRQRRSERPAWH